MDMIEALLGLIWLAVFVSSVVRGISRGLRRAEQEAARQARRRAGSGPAGFPTGWPSGGGRPLGPVIILDKGGDGEGAPSGEEGGQFESEPAHDYGAEPSSADGQWAEGQDVSDGWHGAELETEGESAYGAEPYARVRAWDASSVGGSLPAEEDDLGAVLTVASSSAGDADPWAEHDDGDGAAFDWPGSPGDWSRAALAGIVWSVVLDKPRTAPGAQPRL